MDLIDVLNSQELELPLERTEGDFIAFLKAKFKQFNKLLSSVDPARLFSASALAALPKAQALSRGVIRTLEAYLKGSPEKAYAALNRSLRAMGPHFDVLCPKGNMAPLLSHLYRLRRADEFTLSRKDIWHIPFESRHKVGAMRYSIPGVPCLYLGGSIYSCWEEMQRPALDSVHAARFRATNARPLRVINFGHRPALIAAALQADPTTAAYSIGAAISWPIVAACSVKVLHPEASFKIEHVLPQVVLQWARRNGFDGMRYFSTRIPTYISDPTAQMNYVFPAQTVNTTGQCPVLVEAFESSVPVSWRAAQVAPLPPGPNPPNNWQLALVEGQPMGYYSTGMGTFQASLDPLPLGHPS